MQLSEKLQQLDDQYLNAATQGVLPAVQGAITAGAEKTATNPLGETALHLAAKHGHIPVIDYLCDTLGLAVEARDSQGLTPLLSAAAQGNMAAVEHLAQKRGANIHACDDNGKGILHHAAAQSRYRGTAVFEHAVRLTGQVDTYDAQGCTPLQHMTAQGNLSGVHTALLNGADPLAKGEQATAVSALKFAQMRGMDSFVQVMQPFVALPKLDAIETLTHADLVRENTQGKRLLDSPAVWRNMSQILDVLEQKGEPLPSREELATGGILGEPPMVLALYAGQHDQLERCLAHYGQTFEARDFWNSSQTGIGRFGQVAIEQGVLQREFSLERARQRGEQGCRDFYAALPPEAQESISNYHQLVAQLSRGASSQSRGR